MKPSLEQVALQAAAEGFQVFPCRPGGKEPITPHGLKDATRDTQQIKAWWAKWPKANVAVRTGEASGFFALDPDGEEGAASLAALEDEHGGLPATRAHRTGNGRHLLLRWPDGADIKSRNGKLGHRLDVKANGGYILWPGSVHPSGAIYEVEKNLPMADCPPWLLELVTKNWNWDGARRERAAGQTSAYGRKALDDECAKVATTPDGERNETLNRAAYRIFQLVSGGHIAEGEAVARLTEAARTAGLSAAEIEKTIRSAAAGMGSPRGPEPNERGSSARAEGAEPTPETPAVPWPTATDEMFFGWMGDHAREATENTEADPVATYLTELVAFGVEAGRDAHLRIGDDEHHARLFVAIVGNTSRGRKGTSAGPVLTLFKSEDGDPASMDHRFARLSHGPLSTGEGLAFAVRDPRYEWDRKQQESVMVEAGIADKRLFVLDSEMASALACTKREGNTLSTLLRCFWDGSPAEPLTKTSPTRSTGHHVGIVTHITHHELLKRLPDTENFSGFSNRFLWVCARRPQLVPLPSRMPKQRVREYRKTLLRCLAFAQGVGEITLSDAARDLWLEVYPRLSVDTPGLIGAVTSRSESYTLRLALIFALSDCSREIKPDHLRAALEVWCYCEASARYIFSGAAEDSTQAKILEALADGPKTGTELYKGVFACNVKAEKIKGGLDELKKSGRIVEQAEKTSGRPRVTYALKVRRPDTDDEVTI
ncbi:conserved hypothetical protein [uncultured Desulfatiglans sp.]|uniref:DNA primase/polymerase bifunctional N-terminal domain-containing protein n=1 Tax=Uncultured Desulfatiglans sp. TaxID=1748965 RepID=A0A653A186_UNCDX|nr:conserved hypothetical protein [uncultured Desulfatiglans sp.]